MRSAWGREEGGGGLQPGGGGAKIGVREKLKVARDETSGLRGSALRGQGKGGGGGWGIWVEVSTTGTEGGREGVQDTKFHRKEGRGA